MLDNLQLLTDYIPHEAQLYVNRLRKFLGDTEALNVLTGEKESDDNFLYDCITDALDEINNEFMPVTTWTLSTMTSWNAVKLGATIQVLIGKGILSARNTLTYNDAGGITVADYDKYGRYINYYNILINKYMRTVQSIKLSHNIDSCYGEVASEYAEEFDI